MFADLSGGRSEALAALESVSRAIGGTGGEGAAAAQ
jgi:hypothetical protein